MMDGWVMKSVRAFTLVSSFAANSALTLAGRPHCRMSSWALCVNGVEDIRELFGKDCFDEVG